MHTAVPSCTHCTHDHSNCPRLPSSHSQAANCSCQWFIIIATHTADMGQAIAQRCMSSFQQLALHCKVASKACNRSGMRCRAALRLKQIGTSQCTIRWACCCCCCSGVWPQPEPAAQPAAASRGSEPDNTNRNSGCSSNPNNACIINTVWHPANCTIALISRPGLYRLMTSNESLVFDANLKQPFLLSFVVQTCWDCCCCSHFPHV